MASTLSVERGQVRRWMDDTDPNDYLISTRRLNQIIEAVMHETGKRLKLGQAWQLAAITLSTSTNPPDYSLPATGVQYQQIVDLRRHADNVVLLRVSQQEIQRRRSYLSSPARGNVVSCYALIEDTAQGVTAMFDVIPTVADTVDLLRAVIPANLADDDTAAIPFDRDLLEGFRQGCAGRACRALTQVQRDARGISDDHLAALEASYQQAVRDAEIRSWQQKMSDQSSASSMWATRWP